MANDALISKLAAAIVEELETKAAYDKALDRPLSTQLKRIFRNQWKDAEDRRVAIQREIAASETRFR